MTPSPPSDAAILEAWQNAIESLGDKINAALAPLGYEEQEGDEGEEDIVRSLVAFHEKTLESGHVVVENIDWKSRAESAEAALAVMNGRQDIINDLRATVLSMSKERYEYREQFVAAMQNLNEARSKGEACWIEGEKARAEVERLKAELSEGKANAEWIGNGNAAELFCNKHGYDGCPDCRKENARLTSLLAAKDEALKKVMDMSIESDDCASDKLPKDEDGNAEGHECCGDNVCYEANFDSIVNVIRIALALTPAKPKEDDNG